jgi:DsbC/DsbD-like thiol-disulfide interchange protein
VNEHDPVEVGVALEPGPTPGQRVLCITLTIAPGYHVYAEPAPEGFVPLAVTLEPGGAIASGAAEWPPPERLVIEGIDEEFWVYSGTVVGRIPVELSETEGAIEGEIVYQACTDTLCHLPASVAFSLPLER